MSLPSSAGLTLIGKNKWGGGIKVLAPTTDFFIEWIYAFLVKKSG